MKKTVCWVGMVIIGLFTLSTTAVAESASVKIVELNNEQEYVLIANAGNAPVDLKGWELHDHNYGKTKMYSYTFPDMQLKPHEILQMQSGKAKKELKDSATPGKLDSAQHYILWSNRKVWNDRCDIAYLLDKNGNLVAEKHNGGDLAAGKKADCR